MKKTLLALLSLIFILTINTNLKATHYMGGEITWECLPSGQFQFHVKYYRECGGITFANFINLGSSSPVGNISMSLQTGWPKDLTPQGDLISGCQLINCAWAEQTGYDNTGAVSEYYYISAPVTINGVPPAGGWYFTNGSCCRNPSTNIANSNNKGWLIKAKMYSFNGQNTYPCYDSSPKFIQAARPVFTVGSPITFSNIAVDVDQDSLVFEWGKAHDNTYSEITSYASGYSYNSPLPGPSQDSNNIAATINANNGNISFESYTTGSFVTLVKVSAYKYGVLVSEIWREIQLVLAPGSSSSNTPPTIDTLFTNNTTYNEEVYVGDTVQYSLMINDFEYLPTNPPQAQNVHFSAFGQQFGSYVAGNPGTNSETTGCLAPPCAKLTPAPNDTLISALGLSTDFYWRANCNHISIANSGGNYINTHQTYRFYFNVSDNYCPIPASNTYTLEIKVKAKPIIESPKISCIKVLNNGEVEIKWNRVQDTLSSFKNFNLYLWDSNNSTLADSVYDISDYQDTIQNVNANTSSKSIFINTVSSCDFETPAYDTVSTMFLEATENINGTVELNWNPIRNDNQQHIYKIYKEYPLGNSVFYAYTTNTSYVDTVAHINQVVKYRIRTEDSVYTNSGNFLCASVSNAASIIATSIKDSELENQISIYPNPADDIITIEYGKLKINKLEVYNSNSKLVFHDSELTSKTYKLNPDNLASGTYLLKFFVEDKIVYKKLIVK